MMNTSENTRHYTEAWTQAEERHPQMADRITWIMPMAIAIIIVSIECLSAYARGTSLLESRSWPLMIVVFSFTAGVSIFAGVVNKPKEVAVYKGGVRMDYPLFPPKYYRWSDMISLDIFKDNGRRPGARLQFPGLATPIMISYQTGVSIQDHYLHALGGRLPTATEVYIARRKGCSSRA